MRYKLIKMNLNSIPWKNWHRIENLTVSDPEECIEASDNYVDDEDFDFYVGDAESAFRHAYQTYTEINKIKKGNNQREAQNESRSDIVRLQKLLVQDIKNCLRAYQFSGAEEKHIKQLFVMAVETGCGREIPGIVRYFRDEIRENGELSWPDMTDIYMALGDSALFEERDIDLAVEFYQLVLAMPNAEENEASYKLLSILKKKILHYKMIGNRKLRLVLIKSDIPQINQCLSNYQKFLNTYYSIMTEAGGIQRINKLALSADNFAEVYNDLLNNLLYYDENDWSEELKAELRMCYMMLLQVFNMAFLWEAFLLSRDDRRMAAELKWQIVAGVRISREEVLGPAREYVIRDFMESDKNYEALLWLFQGIAYVELIRNILEGRNLPEELAYYTSLNTLRYMFPERAENEAGRMSVMHVAYMNDPNEGKTFWKFLGSEDFRQGQRESAMYPYVFLKCFTTRIDDLPMWEMYGDRAEGCCIVLPKKWFDRNNLNVPLFRVCYLRKCEKSYEFKEEDNPEISDKKSLVWCLEQLQEIYRKLSKTSAAFFHFQSIVERIIFLFKDANYQHEQEFRIMYSYPCACDAFCHVEMEYPKLYVYPKTRVQIKELILGPKLQGIAEKVPFIQEELEKMCRQTGGEIPQITVSEIEYQ